MSGSNKHITITPVAAAIPFDNSTNGFLSTEVQSAIEENNSSAAISFTWGRSGNTSSGTWLLNDSVPSNKAGRTNVLGLTKIIRIFSASEDLDTYTLQIYEHDGNEINLTLIGSLSVVAARTGNSGAIALSITAGKQLAVLLSSGSAKNIVTGVIPKGGI